MRKITRKTNIDEKTIDTECYKGGKVVGDCRWNNAYTLQ